MTMNRTRLEDLLDRYVKQETSPEENQRIEQWLSESGNEPSAWEQLDRTAQNQWLSNVFSDIQATIRKDDVKTVVLRPRHQLWYKIAGAAAALLITFGLYFLWSSSDRGTAAADFVSISAAKNQKQQIVLPDGSKVWLNSGAELKYPKAFEGKKRVVYLSGEGYFDIQHDDSKPFLIHTRNVLTTVLGTAFNIKEDPKQHTIEVTVTRGKVSVAQEGKTLGILTPNRQLSLNLATGNPTEKIVNAKAVIAWQDADLVFDDITLADAALQLEKHFQVKIKFSNERLKGCRFSGTAQKGEQLEKILNAMTAFNNASFQTQPDGTIIISGHGCD
jgi:ferric-dicitrate binding protein FerR (iron transport regulator)